MSANLAGLSQAHYILHEQGTQLISLSVDDLWRSYLPDNGILTGVKEHLIQTQWLSEQEKWDSIRGEEIDRNQFTALGEDGSEVKSFVSFHTSSTRCWSTFDSVDMGPPSNRWFMLAPSDQNPPGPSATSRTLSFS